MRAVAEVWGYNKNCVFVKVPEAWPTKALTLDREWLKHGFAQFSTLLVEVDPDSIHHDGVGYLADIEIVEGIDVRHEPVDTGTGPQIT